MNIKLHNFNNFNNFNVYLKKLDKNMVLYLHGTIYKILYIIIFLFDIRIFKT